MVTHSYQLVKNGFRGCHPQDFATAPPRRPCYRRNVPTTRRKTIPQARGLLGLVFAVGFVAARKKDMNDINVVIIHVNPCKSPDLIDTNGFEMCLKSVFSWFFDIFWITLILLENIDIKWYQPLFESGITLKNPWCPCIFKMVRGFRHQQIFGCFHGLLDIDKIPNKKWRNCTWLCDSKKFAGITVIVWLHFGR